MGRHSDPLPRPVCTCGAERIPTWRAHRPWCAVRREVARRLGTDRQDTP